MAGSIAPGRSGERLDLAAWGPDGVHDRVAHPDGGPVRLVFGPVVDPAARPRR